MSFRMESKRVSLRKSNREEVTLIVEEEEQRVSNEKTEKVNTRR